MNKYNHANLAYANAGRIGERFWVRIMVGSSSTSDYIMVSPSIAKGAGTSSEGPSCRQPSRTNHLLQISACSPRTSATVEQYAPSTHGPQTALFPTMVSFTKYLKPRFAC
jgi:hypothetical protein